MVDASTVTEEVSALVVISVDIGSAVVGNGSEVVSTT